MTKFELIQINIVTVFFDIMTEIDNIKYNEKNNISADPVFDYNYVNTFINARHELDRFFNSSEVSDSLHDHAIEVLLDHFLDMDVLIDF